MSGRPAAGAADQPAGKPGAAAGENVTEARQRQVAAIGERIRELRRGRMTLAQLAEASGVSVGLLSRLENGVGNPSFGALSAVARALGVDVHSFFDASDEGPTVLAPEDWVNLIASNSGQSAALMVPYVDGPIIGVMLTLPPAFRPLELVSASPGQQFETVLDGTVEFHVEHEVFLLEAGDFILFEASRPHRRLNPSESAQARVLSCSTEMRLISYFPDQLR